MKKINFLVILALIMCFVTGCGNFNKKAEVGNEILNQENLQVKIALGDNYDAKVALLQSKELSSDGLVALCLYPEGLRLENLKIQHFYKEAIERTDLTVEQEVQIAKFDKYAYTKALLLRTRLSPEGLVAVCENPGEVSLRNNELEKMFREAIERVELNAEQEVQIAKLGEFTYNAALLLRTKLTPEGLVAVCENPGDISLENIGLKRMFRKAIERVELNAEQEVQIAKLGEFTYNTALLLRTKLTPEGLVAVCENPGSMNLKNKNIQQLFKNAIKRTALTVEQKNQIIDSELKGIGLF